MQHSGSTKNLLVLLVWSLIRYRKCVVLSGICTGTAYNTYDTWYMTIKPVLWYTWCIVSGDFQYCKSVNTIYNMHH